MKNQKKNFGKFINFISSINFLIKKKLLKEKNKTSTILTKKLNFINSIILLIKKKLLKQKNKTSTILTNKLSFKISSFNKHLITLISLLFIYLFYLTIPNLYDKTWVQTTIESKLFDEFGTNFSISSEISYEILPSPHYTIKNVKFLNDNTENPRNLSEIKELKVFISQKNLFYRDKLKIKHLSIDGSNFSIQKRDFKFFNAFMNSKFSSNRIKIKKSNIFLKDSDEEIILITQISKSHLSYDNTKFFNKIFIEGEIFKIPFTYEFIKDFKKNTNFSYIKSKKLKLKIENETTKIDGVIDGVNDLSILNSKLTSNYQLDDNVFSFESKDQELTNNSIKYNGKLNLDPSNLIINIDLKNIKIKKLFDTDSIFFEFLKSGQFFNDNISAKINVNSLNILDNKFFDSLKIIYNQKNNIINIDETEFLSNKIGLLKLTNTKLSFQNNDLIFNGNFVFKIKDYSKLYTFFQSPKKLRNPIEEIFFNIQFNISNKELIINSLKIEDKVLDEDKIALLNNFNDRGSLEIENFIEFKKLINQIFANYEG
jgi:hypothetical protein